MAQVLNKDPITYQRERDGFLRELQHFHDTRGTPFRRVPQINGQEIDLYLLYILVTAHGGWLKVNFRNEWEDLMDEFKLPQRCVNSGVALKQIYLRYLDRYEKVHFLGDDGGRGSDDDDDSRHKRWSARALHAVPLTYNAYQHVINDSQRVYHGLSTDLYKPSDYDRLAMSLMSPLPNEQDFAINVCTLLSNEGKHTLKLDKCPRLVDFLLAHAAVFSNEGTRELFQDVYGRVRHSSLTHFWADVLEDPEIQHLADETLWPSKSRPAIVPSVFRTDSSNTVVKEPCRSSRETFESASVLDLEECAMDVEFPSDVILGRRKSGESSKTESESDQQKPRIEIEPSDLELFCLGRTMGTQDYLGQRVVQVATILRNLSFGEENQAILATNQTYVRFLLLCLGSRWDSLKQLGLDSLGNIAPELPLERLSSDALLQLIFTSITQRLFGQDRAGIIAALEVLNKLGQREDNEEALQRSLDGKVFEQICRYLTLHDIMLLVQTLECLYSLSSLGERACNCIVRVHGAVETLVSLITVEAQSYGPKACILMRVVETVSGNESHSHSNVTTLQPAAPIHHQPDYSQTGQSGLIHSGPVPIKKVYPPSPMNAKTVPIRPAFSAVQSTSGSPVVTLHPQLALQQQNPQQQTMFPPSSHQPLSHHQSISQINIQTSQASQPMSQMMSVIAQAPPMSTPASVIQHPPSSVSPQPSLCRQTGTPPPSSNQNAQLTAQELVVRENEQFAATFLRSTYENNSGCRVEQSEVYNKYLSACAKAGRKGVIAPHHFPKCVRTVFGVTSVPVVKPVVLAGDTTPSGVSKQHFYEGIKVSTHPHLSQALTDACSTGSTSTAGSSATSGAQPTNTSLIKSLLATKVGETGILNPQPAGMISGNVTSVTPANYNIDVSNIQQVAQRQRMQQQQQQQSQPQSQPSTHLQPPSPPTTISSSPQTQPPQLLVAQSNPPQLTDQSQSQPPELQCQLEAQSLEPISAEEQALSIAVSTILPAQQPLETTLVQPQIVQATNQPPELAPTIVNHKGKAIRVARINGARTPTIIQIQAQLDSAEENHIGGTVLQSRRDPPQPPPPPLAPLSSGSNRPIPQEVCDNASVIKCTNNLIIPDENSTKGINQSSEGVLVNGAAHLEIKSEIKEEETMIEDESNKPAGKPNLMLVDLLDKSVEVREPPVLNGGLSSKDLCISERGLELVTKGAKTDLGKQIRITERGLEVVDTATGGCEKELVGMELRLTERGLELVDKQGEVAQPTPNVEPDNVLQKELSVGEKLLEFLEKQDGNLQDEVMVGPEGDLATCYKRPADEEMDDKSDVKRLRLEVNGNGSNSGDEAGQGEEKVKASSAAANLYSALAASVLEDEDPELLMQPVSETQEPGDALLQQQIQCIEQAAPQISNQPQLQLVQSGGTIRQVYVSSDPNQSAPSQSVMMAGTRQIIVSQALTGQSQMLITTGGTIASGGTTGATFLKTASGQTLPMLMQANTTGGVISGTMARPQGVTTQYVMSHPQGQQLQLVQPGNQIQIASGGVGGHQFVMAQPQTALIQGQPQTVLVAQTPQQQGTSAKTIIILQQQPGTSVPVTGTTQTVHQKVLAMTPQGQQVMVTPVQRPVIQSGAVGHAPPALVATSQQQLIAPSPAPVAIAPTGIPTPVLTANPSPAQSPSIPTPTITANPNASAVPRPNVLRPSPTPSPNASTGCTKPNGVVTNTTAVCSSSLNRIGTRNSVAKSSTMTTITTASSGPSSPAATPVNVSAAKTCTSSTVARGVGGVAGTAPRPIPNQSMFLCEWRGCMRSFKSANEVYMHACESHCPSGSQEIQCLWERCDAMKRKRFSLMTHLFDRHCNAEVLRMMAMRRRQLSQSGRSEIPPPQPPPPHPGYAPNAAFHAIKRHALEFVNPKELLDDNEGPVTKSIRLTAALILRNLVIYSNSGRRMLRSYESHLASVALSNVESSRTVAQVLYDMNHAAGTR